MISRALKLGLLSQDQVDSCDPALMFTIPRLAIVSGLLIFPDGPLALDRFDLSEMFRPFRSLLLKIRELLWTLNRGELGALERALCSVDDTFIDPSPSDFSEDSSMNNKNSGQNLTQSPALPQPPSSGQPNNSTNSTASRNQHNNSSSHHHHHHHHHNNSHYNHHQHHHVHRHTHHHLVHSSTSGEPQSEDTTEGDSSAHPSGPPLPIASHAIQDYLDQFYKDFPQCKDFITDLCHSSSTTTTPTTLTMTSSIDQEEATLAIDNVETKESTQQTHLYDNSPATEPEIGSLSNSSTHSLQYSSLESESPDELPTTTATKPGEDTSNTQHTIEGQEDEKDLVFNSTSDDEGPSTSCLLTGEEHAILNDETDTVTKNTNITTTFRLEETEGDRCDLGDEPIPPPLPSRPTTLDISTTEVRKSFNFEEEAGVPTPLVEKTKRDQDDGLIEDPQSASHSSSSSRDSGLSSMAEKQTTSEPSSNSQTSTALNFDIANSEPITQESNEQTTPSRNSSDDITTPGSHLYQLTTVVMNANRVRPPPPNASVMMTQSQEMCSGSCCNSDCSASLG